MMPQNSRFYDGKTADPYNLDLEISQEKLIGSTSSGNKLIEWDLSTIRVLREPEGNRQAVVTTTKDNTARLYITQSVFQKINFKFHRKVRPLFIIHNSLKSIIFWFIAAIIMLFCIFQFLPKFSPYIVQNLPQKWEESLGEYTFNLLVEKKKICSSEHGIKSLEKIALILNTEKYNTSQITIRVVQDSTINAFAAPGGKIIIYSGLIEGAKNPAEIAGVLAHEMGHALKKHPTENLIRNLGFTLITKLMFVNIDNIKNMSAVGQILVELNYSRKAEQEADQIALQILEEKNIDPNGFKDFFKRQQKENLDTNFDILTYLSTHPKISERINAIKITRTSKKYKQLLSEKEWKMLKEICR